MEADAAADAIVTLSLEDIAHSYVEIWRLEKLIETVNDRTVASAIRRIIKHLKSPIRNKGFDLIDFEGRAYDAGLIPEVIDVIMTPGENGGEDVVFETVEPTITFNGRILIRGQIVLKRVDGTALKDGETEA